MSETNTLTLKRNKTKRIGMAIVLGSFAGIAPLSTDMYLPSLPLLVEDFQSSTSVAQLTLTSSLLGMALGQLFIGPLSDQKGRRIPLVLSLIVYCVSSFLCALAPSVWVLILLRFIQGVSGAGGMVISRAIVRDMYTGIELTKFFALLMLINGAAPILAPVAGGQILQFTTWRGVFIVLGVLGIIMVSAAFFSVQETLAEENRIKGGIKNTLLTLRKLLTDKIFMGYVFTQGFVTAAMFSYISGSPFVIQNVFGASPQMFSIIFAINGMGIIIASQTTGRLAGKVKESTLLKIGLSIALLGGLLLVSMLTLDVGLVGVLPSLFLVVSSVGIVGTTTFSLAMQSQGKSAGSAAALLGLMPFILGSIMAPLVGIGNVPSPWPMAIGILSCQLVAVLSYRFAVKGAAK
ncbi:multidrug effflux MFS transporter [Bacillus benzoevorans]|uniref:Bcr/CflA family efflux transporter n=1 Tax=Bacillus benzoevorans TaxID=1456 RepID=A0A7X0LUN2_9BACI|nr:multidrug effflux MFS transporter [Bacillus benzoevorans]MBB6445136.1 DHA1 family bicyclomycin/chloramphenicol resistance-like MFS transporter [Bacillus benzoevorans]